jgi:hypothetical protein
VAKIAKMQQFHIVLGSFAEIAQLVEHATENRSVRGPIPRLGTSAANKPSYLLYLGVKEVFC